MTDASAILIDWGTSSFRAWLVDGSGAVLDRRDAPRGLLQVPAGGYPRALEEEIGAWRAARPDLPVLMSGMVGSRQGWAEAPYAPCPAGIADLAAAVIGAPGAPGVRIVPGVSCVGPDGRHDVMRGEEVQIFGALGKAAATGRHVLCLPGTHSKWAVVEGGRIRRFVTAMTGEVFAVLSAHSILGRLMEGDGIDDMATFRRGLALSGGEGGLLNHLFAVRAEGLFRTVPAAGLRAYLSGILIGHEIRAMATLAQPADPVILVGRGAISELYAEALAALGHAAAPADVEAATRAGLRAIQKELDHG